MLASDRGVSTLTTPGHIYFAQADGGGLIKIGWATWPALRIERMQPHCPVILRLLHTEPGNGRQERALHARFAPARKHGEWFEPIPELLAYIEERRGLNAVPAYEPVDVGPYRLKGGQPANYASRRFLREQGKR